MKLTTTVNEIKLRNRLEIIIALLKMEAPGAYQLSIASAEEAVADSRQTEREEHEALIASVNSILKVSGE